MGSIIDHFVGVIRQTVRATRRVAPTFLIILLGFAAYSNSLHGEFQFDDKDFIVNNPAIRDISDVKAVFHSHGIPLRFVAFYSFALNYHFHGLDVFGYHLINLIIHLLNGCLVFWLARLILGESILNAGPYGRPDGSPLRDTIALFAALIFVLHPLQTEAVSYITQRFASLATLFYLASFCSFIHYRRERYPGFLIAALALGVIATFTKQISFTLPIMILLYDLYFPQSPTDTTVRATRRVAPTIIIAAAFLLIMPLAYKFNAAAIIGADYASRSHEGDYLFWLTYGLTQFRVICTYLRLLFWPAGLNFDYDFPISTTLLEPKTFACFLLIVTLLYTAIRLYRANRLVSFCLLWFFVTLSVESSVIMLPHVIYEHRMYLPLAGLSILISYGFFSLIRNQRAAIAILAMILAVFGHLTYERNKTWQNGIALWSDVIRKSPNKSRPYHNRGFHYLQKGAYKEALADFNVAIEREPQYLQAYSNRATAHRALGNVQAALEDYNQAIALNTRNPQALHNRGQLYAQLGQVELALADFAQALAIRPDYFLAYYNRGKLWAQLKEYDKARADFDRAIELNPDFKYSQEEKERMLGIGK